MKDAGFNMFTGVLIGAMGLTVLVLAWLQPMPASERILTFLIGAGGLSWALLRLLSLRAKPLKVNAGSNASKGTD